MVVIENGIHSFGSLLKGPAGVDTWFTADPSSLLRRDWCTNITGCPGRNLWATWARRLLHGCRSVLFWDLYHVPYHHRRSV